MGWITQVSQYINILTEIYSYVIIAYILLSWLPNARESKVGIWLGRLVEPYLSPFRKLIPPIGGMLDLSPILALFALRFLAEGIKAVIIYVVGFFM